MSLTFATTDLMMLSVALFLGLRTVPHDAASAGLVDLGGIGFWQLPLVREAGGVPIGRRLEGLPPGSRAMHVHAVRACSGRDLESAGARFYSYNPSHGVQNKNGPDAGDFPQIAVRADGGCAIDRVGGSVAAFEVTTGPIRDHD
jgi:Cu-Zn family superoxide dismutase